MSDLLYGGAAPHVLCPGLYMALQRRFGSVTVALQGQSFLAQSRLDPVTGRQATSVALSGEYYRVNCFACGDTRQRLWINHMFGQPDAGGRRMLFLAVCYNENCLREYANVLQLEEICYGLRNGRQVMPVFPVLPGEIDTASLTPAVMPGTVWPITQFGPGHKAWDYLFVRRRYTVQMAEAYEIGYCVEAHPDYRMAGGRLIFPIKMHGTLVGWQARCPDELDWKAVGFPKYYSRPGMKRNLLLYNYDRAKHMPFVVVTEGPTDVHRLGDVGVGVLGKTIALRQKELLASTWAGKPILLMFDPEAAEEMRGEADELRRTCRSPVAEIQLPGRMDPNDYETSTLWNLVYAQATAAGICLPSPY